MSYASEVLADSPLHWWPFDETTGTTAGDSSGNSRPGTINGSPTLGATKVMPAGSTSFDFPGATTEYVVRTQAAWMVVSSFTITAWIRLDTTSSYRCIWSRDTSNVGFTRGPSFYVTSGKLNLYDGSDHLGTTTLSTGTDYFVAATFDSTSGTLKYYINGTLDATLTSISMPNSQNYDIVVGASHAATAGLNFPFDGRIEEPAYFGTALSGARIAAHYAAGTAPPPISGSFAATLPTLTSAFTGTVSGPATGSFAATLPKLAGSFAGSYLPPPFSGSFAATLPKLTASFSGRPPAELGSLDATLPLLAASFVGAYDGPIPTDTSNAMNGLDLVMVGTTTQTRPVVAPPATVVLAKKYDKARALPTPVMDNGRPT